MEKTDYRLCNRLKLINCVDICGKKISHPRLPFGISTKKKKESEWQNNGETRERQREKDDSQCVNYSCKCKHIFFVICNFIINTK